MKKFKASQSPIMSIVVFIFFLIIFQISLLPTPAISSFYSPSLSFCHEDFFPEDNTLLTRPLAMKTLTAHLEGIVLAERQVPPPDKNLLQETQCLRNITNRMILALNQVFSGPPEGHLEISSLLTVLQTLLDHYSLKSREYLRKMELEEIMSDDFLYRTVLEVGREVDLEELALYLKKSIRPGNLLFLARLLDDPIDPVRPQAVLDKYTLMIKEQGTPDSQKALMKVLALHLLKNGYKFTEKGRKSYLHFYEKKLLLKKMELGGLYPNIIFPSHALWGKIKNLRAEIGRLKKDIHLLKGDSQRGLAKAFGLWKTMLEEESLEEGAEEVFSWAGKFFHDNYPFQKFSLREGDIVLSPTDHNAWSIFHMAVSLPYFAIHTAIIAQEQDGPFDYYYQAEFFERGLETIDIMQDEFPKIFIRPLEGGERGFVRKALDNLTRLGPTHFDILFREGIFNKKNEIRLYCSEFVHYLFKNHYRPDGREFPSPFDSVLARVKPENPMVRENMIRMGLAPSFTVVLPEYLFYSRFSRVVGMALGLENREYALQSRFLKRKMSERAGSDLLALFSGRPFKKMGFWEKAFLESLWQSTNLLSRFPFLRGKFPDLTAASDLEIPQGESRHFYLRFGLMFLELDNFLNGISPLNGDGQYDPSWKEKSEDHYQKVILPKLINMFEPAT